MIDKQFCIEQVMRLSGLDRFPVRDGGIEELATILESGAKSKTHARRIVDSLVMGYSCPAPRDLKRACIEVSEVPETIPEGCDICGGSSWRQVIRGDLTGMERCSCPKGRHFARKDAERNALEGARTRTRNQKLDSVPAEMPADASEATLGTKERILREITEPKMKPTKHRGKDPAVLEAETELARLVKLRAEKAGREQSQNI